MHYGTAAFVITRHGGPVLGMPVVRLPRLPDPLVGSGEWPGLIAYVGLEPTGARGVRGFRDHHTPGAVAFTPGTPWPGRPETATRPAAKRRAIRAAQGCDLRW